MSLENETVFVAKAEQLINEYCLREFGTPANGKDGVYAIGYTTDGEGRYDLNFEADVNKREIIFKVNDKTVAIERHGCDESFLDTLEYVKFETYVSAIDEIAETLFENDCICIPYWNLGYTMLAIQKDAYEKGNGLAVGFFEATEYGFMPYAHPFTVNLTAYPTSGNRAFLDMNNCRWALALIELYGLGKPTGRIGFSGRCTYPEYEFDLKEISKYSLR